MDRSRKMPGGPGGSVGVRRTFTDKRRLRTTLLRQLTTQKEEDRRRRSEAIRQKLVRLAVFRRAKTVMCYVSLSYEVETRRLIEQMLQAGKRVVVPVVRNREVIPSALRDPATELARGSFGVWEPRREAVRPVPLDELDLILVPGLAFDRKGHRLGHGGGYFDRLLARLPHTIPTVGLCFTFQLLDRLPTRPHDQTVQTILSA